MKIEIQARFGEKKKIQEFGQQNKSFGFLDPGLKKKFFLSSDNRLAFCNNSSVPEQIFTEKNPRTTIDNTYHCYMLSGQSLEKRDFFRTEEISLITTCDIISNISKIHIPEIAQQKTDLAKLKNGIHILATLTGHIYFCFKCDNENFITDKSLNIQEIKSDLYTVAQNVEWDFSLLINN